MIIFTKQKKTDPKQSFEFLCISQETNLWPTKNMANTFMQSKYISDIIDEH